MSDERAKMPPKRAVELFLAFLRPVTLVLVWPMLLTTCVPPFQESWLSYPVGWAEAAHYAATQDDPPMCGRSGVPQLRNGNVIRCRVPAHQYGPRAIGWRHGQEKFGMDVIPARSLLHARKVESSLFTPEQLLRSADLGAPRGARVAALLALSPHVSDSSALLGASDEAILEAVGHSDPLSVATMKGGIDERRMVRFYLDGQAVVYDAETNLVLARY